MKWFKNLSPQQRQLLIIGVPVVAVFALVMALRGNGAGEDDAAEDTGTDPAILPGSFAPAGGGDAIGAGQLSSFQDALTGELDVLHQQLDAQRARTQEALQAQQDAYQDFLNDVAGSGSQLPSGGFQIDDPPETIGIYTIDNELVRVGGDPAGGNANVRKLSEYGSAGGRPGIIDTIADQRFVEQKRGVGVNDPETARLILQGEFGPVAAAFKPRLRRVANG